MRDEGHATRRRALFEGIFLRQVAGSIAKSHQSKPDIFIYEKMMPLTDSRTCTIKQKRAALIRVPPFRPKNYGTTTMIVVVAVVEPLVPVTVAV